MKVLIFSVVLVTVRVTNSLTGQIETENVSSATSQSLQVLIGELADYRKNIEDKFESLQKTCQELVTGCNAVTISIDEEKKMEKMMENFEDKMLRFSIATTETISQEISKVLENSLKKLDEKLEPVQSEIDSLKSQMTVMMTKDDLERVENELKTIGTNVTAFFKEQMSQLLTEEDMLHHHNELQNKLEILSTPENETRCEVSSKLEEILANSDSLLNEVFAYLKNDSRNSHCSSTMDGLTELLMKLDNGIDNNWQSAVALETLVQNMEKNFLSKLENLPKLTEDGEVNGPGKETKVLSLPIISPVECVDSNFIGGGRSLNVCQTAVRFQKCHLEFVAFHCCQSCQKAGLLSSLPHYTGPRNVPVLQALRSMRPFA